MVVTSYTILPTLAAAADPSLFTSMPKARGILHATGRVVVNPTNLSAAYPYGGVEVGLTRGAVLRNLSTGLVVFSEGFGGITDVLEPDDHWVFVCQLRGANDNALRVFFPDHQSEGATTRHRVLTMPNSSYAGASALGRAVVLLFVPDDLVNVPALLIHTAIPDFDDSAEILLQRREEYSIPVAFQCLRGSTGKCWQTGRLPDLTLS